MGSIFHNQPPRALTLDKINQNVCEAEYAVRGQVALTAERYRSDLQGCKAVDLPFSCVVSANIGNPQEVGQKPITFFRQVLSLMENPLLLDHQQLLVGELGYGVDVIARAQTLLGHVKSVGAYSASKGVPAIRENVAKFIERRDGYPANAEDIYLTTGASAGVANLLQCICASPKVGVLVPIPQYPLYTATLRLLNAVCVPYYLEESSEWSTEPASIEEALKAARASGIDVRAIVIINPGNPTGACLEATNIDSILRLASKERLVCIADEVYQANVFEGEFTSCKQRLRALQETEAGGALEFIELVSLHSISKGMVGECGHRGGYMELVGFEPEVTAQIYKLVSISLCPPVTGQCLVDLMVNPPKPGDASYDVYQHEYSAIFDALRTRACALQNVFEQMEGVECQPAKGSMYLFPKIKLPLKAVQAAANRQQKPDEFYALKLLDATGICVVAGSGFGQREGSWHFRTTFLPPGEEWIERFKAFHSSFMDEYR